MVSVTGPATALEEVLRDPEALAEWERFCENYADGKYEHARPPSPPAVIRAILREEEAFGVPPALGESSALASPASYLKNQYGRPETAAELLEFYQRNGHFHGPVPSNNREARRAAVIRRYGLDDYKRQGFINEIAAVARSYFRQTVLVTVVLANEVLLLGSAQVEEDRVDWDVALAGMPQSVSICRHSVLSQSEVIVINDPTVDWRLRKNGVFQGGGGQIGNQMNAPFVLPTYDPDSNDDTDDLDGDSIAAGGFCLLGTEIRRENPFSQADQELLANLGKLAAREILRGFGESERARAEQQASFLSEYIGLETKAVTSIVALTRADAALLLDLRDMVETAKDPGLIKSGIVLGSDGFPVAAGSLIKDQARVRAIAASTATWTSSTVSSASSLPCFDFLAPEQSTATLAIPIFDHKGSLALVVLLSSFYNGPFVIESCDRTFCRNLGQLSLSMLIKHQAVHVERAKLAFISMISHELRTPIHGLAGSLEMLRLDDLDKTSTLAVANECVDALRSTVDEILLLGSLAGGAAAQRQWSAGANEEANAQDVLFDIIKSAWENGTKERNVDVILDVAEREGPWVVQGHSAGFQRIATALVSNACKFTISGYVRVSLDSITTSDGSSAIKLTVTDTGIGMTDSFISSGLFEPFRKVDTFTGGPGLGMACVSHLLQLMDGSCTVESVLGSGTTVNVTLPITFAYSTPPCPNTVRVISDELPPSWHFSAVPELSSPEASEQTISFNIPPSSSSSTSGSSQGEVSPPPSSASSDGGARRPLRILAAEDNHVARNILKGLFKNRELYDLLAVEDGSQAVDTFPTFRPDVTLMDIQMPNKDGIAAAHEIRLLEVQHQWPRHRIIALTSLSNSVDRDRALDGPMDAWEVKGGKSLKTIQAELAAIQLSL